MKAEHGLQINQYSKSKWSKSPPNYLYVHYGYMSTAGHCPMGSQDLILFSSRVIGTTVVSEQGMSGLPSV